VAPLLTGQSAKKTLRGRLVLHECKIAFLSYLISTQSFKLSTTLCCNSLKCILHI